MRMLRHNRLFQAAVAAGIVALGASDALAWGHKSSYGSSSSSSGSYGSSSSGSSSSGSSSSSSYGSYGSSSSSSYASYGSSSSSSSASYGSASYGSSSSGSSSSGGRQGFFARWHAKKAAKQSSGSSSSYGTYAYSSSGSSASYGSSSSGSSASYGGYAAPSGYYDNGMVPADSVPADGAAPMETAPMGAPTEPQPAPPTEPAASIRVNVPADALVFVNDRPTTSTGTERSYVSRGLAGGRIYAYELRVEFTVDGEKVVENKAVRLHAGESIDLSFGSGAQVAAEGDASTDLTLHVPASATVTLAGAVTQQTGETRTYATSSLAPGQEWDGYVVRVELTQNGKTLVEEKTLSILGGKAYELSFDFAGSEAQVASLN